MVLNEIKDLMSEFDTSSLRELAIKKGDLDLYFSKNEQSKPVPVQAVPVLSQEIVKGQHTPVSQENTVDDRPVSREVEGEEIQSPLVGIAYLAPAPDKAPFVEVGQTVKKGQTLLIIEAMKVMNEVPAPHDGLVTEILVNNGDMVEFGKGLVRLK